MRGVKCVKVSGDSDLIVNQVRGLHMTKNDKLKGYKQRVLDLIEDFDAFNIVAIHRKLNHHVDRLAVVVAEFSIVDNISKEVVQKYIKVVVRPSIPKNDVNWKFFDSNEKILNFLLEEDLHSTFNQQKMKD